MTETRVERKERTRRAILDAALELCEDSSLVALSLRQVAGRVGIVPTGFYRHFNSIEALGLALVDESFVSLRAMLRDVRRVEAGGTAPVSYKWFSIQRFWSRRFRHSLKAQNAWTGWRRYGNIGELILLWPNGKSDKSAKKKIEFLTHRTLYLIAQTGKQLTYARVV